MNLRDQQAAFVVAYVAGAGNASKAAVEAGYSHVTARQQASRLLSTPHVQEAIAREQIKTLRGRLASKALAVLERVMDDQNAPVNARVEAAKTVLDRAGLVALRTAEGLPDEKPLGQMSLAELEAYIARGQEKLVEIAAINQVDAEDVTTL